MKTLLFSIFTFFYITSFSQMPSDYFESEADVLQYLTKKSHFTNQRTGTQLTFSDMGSTLRIGQSRCYNPDVTIISSTRAVVVYQSLSNPDAKVQLIVDSKENLIMDKQDRSSIYKANSYQEESPKPATTQPSKPTTKKKKLIVKKLL